MYAETFEGPGIRPLKRSDESLPNKPQYQPCIPVGFSVAPGIKRVRYRAGGQDA